MDEKRCLEILSNIIVDCSISLQEYEDKREAEKFQEKIDALIYARDIVREKG